MRFSLVRCITLVTLERNIAMTPCVVANTETVIQYGTIAKYAAGQIEVQFSQHFATPPTVVLTPYWTSQTSAVGSIETVTGITTTSFTLSSQNHGSTYYVNWIAIGQ
jgi:H-type lectin domain